MTIYNQFPQYAASHDEPENEMPYAYGMSNQLPLPMNPSPASSMPPLFPSMMTPELYPQAPFSSSNLMQARYAEGGEVSADDMMQEGPEGELSALAQLIQQYGEGEDTILAHINREEARQLAEKYGYDINSMTGLPQFGFFKKLKKAVKSVGKVPKKASRIARKPKQLLRYIAPVAGAVAGGLLGGPAGAAIGGGLGGAGGAAVAKKDILKGALLGAAGGYGYGSLLPMVAPETAASLGLSEAAAPAMAGIGASGAKELPVVSGFGTVPGMKALGPATGLKGFGASLPGGSGGLGAMFGPAGAGAAATKAASLGSLAPTSLGSLAAAGGAGATLKGLAAQARRAQREETEQPQSTLQKITSLLSDSGVLDKALLATAVGGTLLRREKTPRDPSLDELVARAPQWRPDQYPRNFRGAPRQVIPFPGQYDPSIHGEHAFFSYGYPEVQYYNHGGAVDMDEGGFLDGDTDGHEDRIPAKLSDGEFVVDATTVAHLGNGNNRAGAKILQNMVDNVRRHKGVKGFPPKAKSISQYMQMRPRY